MSNKVFISLGIVFLIPFLLTIPATIQAQSTFLRVYDILQTNCSGAYCHGTHGADRPKLIDNSPSIVYANIVGMDALNQAAREKGHKIVEPGYPSRSLLLRKIAHGISHDLTLGEGEGEPMPKDQSKLSDAEIELVRQWILFGAPETGKVVNEQLLTRYYNGEGLPKLTPLAPPEPGKGIQIYEGPYFLDVGQEEEYFHKIALNLPDEVEVYKMEILMHQYSHHMILYKYNPGMDLNMKAGARAVSSIADQYDILTSANFIATWQYNRNIELPEGTAYIWDEHTVIDANYHIPNYNDTAIVAAEFYLNLYYRPRQQETVEMFADLEPYGLGNGITGVFDLNILNNSTDTTFVMNQYYPNFNEKWYFWVVQAHTHKLGVDYDIWLRNEDGTKGEQIYEGFYDQEYQFYQGYYAWDHPPVRTFWPLLEVDMSKGLIHEATYYNDGPKPVGFGLTSVDEMFITYYQYTKKQPVVGIREKESDAASFSIYPNPFENMFHVEFTLKESSRVVAEIYNMLGEKITTMFNENYQPGTHKELFNDDLKIPTGVYFITLTAGDHTSTRKIIQMK